MSAYGLNGRASRTAECPLLGGKADIDQPLLDPVSALGLWPCKNRAAIADARARFDAGPARRAG